MKPKKLIYSVLIASIIVWLADAVIYSVFQGFEEFFNLLILKIPVNVLYFRLFLIYFFIIFAIFIYFDLRKQLLFKQVHLRVPEFILDEDREDYQTLNNFFHSIRTQLNNIVGFTNLLRDESSDKEVTEIYLGNLESSKESLLSSVESLVEEYREKKQIQENIKLPGTDEELDWESKTILIAEDVENNYLIISFVLKKTGATIIWVKNGLEAVNVIKEGKNIDLILMDIIMPEMDGFEATRQIRKINPDIPVIAQTAYSYNRNEFEENIFDEYLLKPIWKNDLLQKCSQYLSKKVKEIHF